MSEREYAIVAMAGNTMEVAALEVEKLINRHIELGYEPVGGLSVTYAPSYAGTPWTVAQAVRRKPAAAIDRDPG